MLVLADVLLLLVRLQLIPGVAAHIADRDPRLLRILMGKLGQLLAAFLGQVRDRQPDILAVDDRVDAEARITDRLLDRADVLTVPDLDRKHARLRNADAAHLVQRHRRAVNLDVDRLEEVGAGASGAEA